MGNLSKDHLNNQGESLVAVQWNLSMDYYVVQCSKYEWKVLIMAPKMPEGPIPVFRRVRLVEVGQDGRLYTVPVVFSNDMGMAVVIF
jgi:hypothetical protein